MAQAWRNHVANPLAESYALPHPWFNVYRRAAPLGYFAPVGQRASVVKRTKPDKISSDRTGRTKSDKTRSGAAYNPHDAFFKQLFARSAIAASFCAHYLPRRIAKSLQLDANALTLMPTETLDRLLRGRRADVAYRVARADDSSLYIFVILEHKSYLDPLAAFQITRYCMGIWEAEIAEGRRRLSLVLPVVVYHGRRPWRAATDLGGLIDAPASMKAFLPHLHYHLVSLSTQDPPPRRGLLSLRVGLEVLHAIFRSGRDFEACLATALARLAALGEPDLIAEEVAPILLYANQVHAELTAERLERVVNASLPELGGVVMDKTFESLIQEGRRKGRAEGVEEGVRQGHEAGLRAGLQEAVRLGMELKFGADGLDLLPEIRSIHEVRTLRAILEGLPRMQTVDDLRSLLGRST